MTGGLHPRVLHKQFGGVVNRPAGIVEPPAQIGLLHRVEERLAKATGLVKRLAADQHCASEECGHCARSGCGAAAEPGNMSGARSALIVDDAHGVWLLEANSSPDMSRTAAPLRRIVDAGLDDLVDLVVALKHERTPVMRLAAQRAKQTAPGWRLAHKGRLLPERDLSRRRLAKRNCMGAEATSLAATLSKGLTHQTMLRSWLATLQPPINETAAAGAGGT